MMADTKLTALTAASALAGADLFYVSQGGVSKKATHTQLLTLVGTTYVPLAGGTMTGALRISTLYTDASNYERLTLTGVAGTSVNLTAESAGTGSATLNVVVTPKGGGHVNVGNLLVVANDGAIRTLNSGAGGRVYLDFGNIVLRRGDGASIAGAIKFGGETTSFAAIKGSGASLLVRIADDSGDAPLSALYVKTASTTVAALTAAATAGAGARAFVTDANATTDRSVVAGGGANKVPVFSDGTNWLIG